ncbi:MAG: hypothetical protein FRX49_11729 [Trebouxia sp. A1-2]|nr:MAG: hypothetical protein FRX49_11729 [Trebouxia sp. A1-2]
MVRLQGEWRSDATWTTGFINRIQPTQNVLKPLAAQSPLLPALPETAALLTPGPSTAAASPFVQFQAVFTLIPAGYLTLPQVEEAGSSLSAAISTWVSPLPVAVNISLSNSATAAPSTAASSTSGRRHLLQSSLTFQSTVTFLLTFTAQTVSTPNRDILSSDLSAAISLAVAPLTVATTLTPVLSGAYYALNASVVFPQDNIISATPSQATLAAVTLANALTANVQQALPGLAAKDGPINVTGVSIQDALVPAGPPSSTHTPPTPPQANLPSALNINSPPTGKHGVAISRAPAFAVSSPASSLQQPLVLSPVTEPPPTFTPLPTLSTPQSPGSSSPSVVPSSSLLPTPASSPPATPGAAPPIPSASSPTPPTAAPLPTGPGAPPPSPLPEPFAVPLAAPVSPSTPLAEPMPSAASASIPAHSPSTAGGPPQAAQSNSPATAATLPGFSPVTLAPQPYGSAFYQPPAIVQTAVSPPSTTTTPQTTRSSPTLAPDSPTTLFLSSPIPSPSQPLSSVTGTPSPPASMLPPQLVFPTPISIPGETSPTTFASSPPSLAAAQVPSQTAATTPAFSLPPTPLFTPAPNPLSSPEAPASPASTPLSLNVTITFSPGATLAINNLTSALSASPGSVLYSVEALNGPVQIQNLLNSINEASAPGANAYSCTASAVWAKFRCPAKCALTQPARTPPPPLPPSHHQPPLGTSLYASSAPTSPHHPQAVTGPTLFHLCHHLLAQCNPHPPQISFPLHRPNAEQTPLPQLELSPTTAGSPPLYGAPAPSLLASNSLPSQQLTAPVQTVVLAPYQQPAPLVSSEDVAVAAPTAARTTAMLTAQPQPEAQAQGPLAQQAAPSPEGFP